MQLLNCALLVLSLGSIQAYNVAPSVNQSSRRALFQNVAAVAAAGALGTIPSPALASGGATAGKYT